MNIILKILEQHAVVWHCMHVHFKEGVTGEVLKEVINLDFSPDKTNLQTFVAALITSIWALADESVKFFPVNL